MTRASCPGAGPTRSHCPPCRSRAAQGCSADVEDTLLSRAQIERLATGVDLVDSVGATDTPQLPRSDAPGNVWPSCGDDGLPRHSAATAALTGPRVDLLCEYTLASARRMFRTRLSRQQPPCRLAGSGLDCAGPGAGCPPRGDTKDLAPGQGGSGATVSLTPTPKAKEGPPGVLRKTNWGCQSLSTSARVGLPFDSRHTTMPAA